MVVRKRFLPDGVYHVSQALSMPSQGVPRILIFVSRALSPRVLEMHWDWSQGRQAFSDISTGVDRVKREEPRGPDTSGRSYEELLSITLS